jgi:peptide/nickel transport system ATP-binding protein
MFPLLSIQDLTIGFQSEDGLAPGVEGVNLQVARGESLALVGESGSGKSITSLSILQLLPSPPAKYISGKILFSSGGDQPVDLLKQGPKQMQRIRGQEIAMIFQEPMSSLDPVFSCGAQVSEAIRAHQKITSKEAREKAIVLFEKVRLPDPAALFRRYPHQLSGGQKQRVMIAMAMSCSPSLLICDEPTTALDTTVQAAILQLIKELQQSENMGVIFITHDLGVVAEIADRALVMYKGRPVEEGGVKELFRNPKHPYTKGLLNCRPVLHARGERLPVVADYIQGENAMTLTGRDDGNEMGKAADGQINSRGGSVERGGVKKDLLIQVQDLHVGYHSKKTYTKAVDGISFDVYKGETLGLVGESGCGKTTLGRALLRLVEPDAGRILFEGVDLATYKAEGLKKLRRHIQIIFQDPYSSLNPRLTIGSAIAEPLKVHGLVEGRGARKERVIELLEKVSLGPEHFNRYPHEFSGGQRQRIVIARALALNPDFIVCDESVSALDVSVQAQVLNLLNDLKATFGFTIVFISHDLSVVRYISDRILVMNKGKIEEIGEAETVYRHPKAAYTQRLIDSIPKGI